MLLAENEFPLFESTSAATVAYIYLIYPYLEYGLRQWFSTFFFLRAALWSKCKSHGPHACHLHITSLIQTNQIYYIIYRLNIISKRLHLFK